MQCQKKHLLNQGSPCLQLMRERANCQVKQISDTECSAVTVEQNIPCYHAVSEEAPLELDALLRSMMGGEQTTVDPSGMEVCAWIKCAN